MIYGKDVTYLYNDKLYKKNIEIEMVELKKEYYNDVHFVDLPESKIRTYINLADEYRKLFTNFVYNEISNIYKNL